MAAKRLKRLWGAVATAIFLATPVAAQNQNSIQDANAEGLQNWGSTYLQKNGLYALASSEGRVVPRRSNEEGAPYLWRVQWLDYQYARDQGYDALDKEIAACRAKPQNCHPRFRAWVELIDTVSKIDDPRVKLDLVNGFINTLIAFNTIKTWEAPFWKTDPLTKLFEYTYYQTPVDTLVAGSGVCADYAVLKYETLRRVGFPLGDLYLVSGLIGEKIDAEQTAYGFHLVAMAKARGQYFILNNNPPESDTSLFQPGNPTPSPRQIAAFAANAAVLPVPTDASGVRAASFRFVPPNSTFGDISFQSIYFSRDGSEGISVRPIASLPDTKTPQQELNYDTGSAAKNLDKILGGGDYVAIQVNRLIQDSYALAVVNDGPIKLIPPRPKPVADQPSPGR